LFTEINLSRKPAALGELEPGSFIDEADSRAARRETRLLLVSDFECFALKGRGVENVVRQVDFAGLRMVA
jgi:hypothetical protein